MPILKITVYGIDGDDARHLEEILSNSPDVEEVTTRFRTHDTAPGTIHACAPFVKYAVEFIAFEALNIASGVGAEIGKDIYTEAKKRVQRRIEKWRDEKNEESKYERISFVMRDDGELMIPKSKRNL